MPRPPAELGIDFMSGTFVGGDPHAAYAWMRRHEPVFYDEANGLWAVAKYRDIKAVATDTATYSNAGGVRPKFGPLPMMIDFDAPEHVRRRRLVSAGFTPARVRALEDHVRAVCDRIIDGVCERGECDFVSEVAALLPLAMIGDLLGVDEADRPTLLRWSEEMLRSQGGEADSLEGAMVAFAEYGAYMGPVIETRRASGRDDDLIGVLVNTGEGDDRLDHDSLIHETLLILVGGDETTRHVISGGMAALAAHPGQRRRLAEDPALMASAVEEMLRWVTPIKNMARTATRDTELGGRRISEGDELLLLYPSGNRDEEVFSDPERFDISRSPNPHIAFGFGAHFCLGNQLARLELRVMFERLLARLPDLALKAAELPTRRSNFISGIEAMPVTFTPTQPVGAAA